MGRVGLTEKQEEELKWLNIKPTRTDKQLETLNELIEKKNNAQLPQTAKTYLHEWYANDHESLYTKEINKGNAVEMDAIEFMCDILHLGFVERNLETKWDEHFTGTCDVDADILNAIIDLKAPWNRTTFQSNITGMNSDYKWQGIGYCHLWKREKFILFYALMDTPADVNYDKEVVYSDMPAEQRWIAYETPARPDLIEEVKSRVELCRTYLIEYDEKVRAKVGRITKIE